MQCSRTIFSALLLLCTLAGVSPVHGAEKCDAPEGSTRFEVCELRNETVAAERKLRELLAERLNTANAPTALRESQAAWIRYRDKSCRFEQAEYEGANSVNFARCMRTLTGERVRYLEELQ